MTELLFHGIFLRQKCDSKREQTESTWNNMSKTFSRAQETSQPAILSYRQVHFPVFFREENILCSVQWKTSRWLTVIVIDRRRRSSCSSQNESHELSFIVENMKLNVINFLLTREAINLIFEKNLLQFNCGLIKSDCKKLSEFAVDFYNLAFHVRTRQ